MSSTTPTFTTIEAQQSSNATRITLYTRMLKLSLTNVTINNPCDSVNGIVMFLTFSDSAFSGVGTDGRIVKQLNSVLKISFKSQQSSTGIETKIKVPLIPPTYCEKNSSTFENLVDESNTNSNLYFRSVHNSILAPDTICTFTIGFQDIPQFMSLFLNKPSSNNPWLNEFIHYMIGQQVTLLCYVMEKAGPPGSTCQTLGSVLSSNTIGQEQQNKYQADALAKTIIQIIVSIKQDVNQKLVLRIPNDDNVGNVLCCDNASYLIDNTTVTLESSIIRKLALVLINKPKNTTDAELNQEHSISIVSDPFRQTNKTKFDAVNKGLKKYLTTLLSNIPYVFSTGCPVFALPNSTKYTGIVDGILYEGQITEQISRDGNIEKDRYKIQLIFNNLSVEVGKLNIFPKTIESLHFDYNRLNKNNIIIILSIFIKLYAYLYIIDELPLNNLWILKFLFLGHSKFQEIFTIIDDLISRIKHERNEIYNNHQYYQRGNIAKEHSFFELKRQFLSNIEAMINKLISIVLPLTSFDSLDSPLLNFPNQDLIHHLSESNQAWKAMLEEKINYITSFCKQYSQTTNSHFNPNAVQEAHSQGRYWFSSSSLPIMTTDGTNVAVYSELNPNTGARVGVGGGTKQQTKNKRKIRRKTKNKRKIKRKIKEKTKKYTKQKT
jgi:hypothetical protein